MNRAIGSSNHRAIVPFWIFDWDNPKPVILLVTRHSPFATCYCFRDRVIDILLMQTKFSPVLLFYCGYPAIAQGCPQVLERFACKVFIFIELALRRRSHIRVILYCFHRLSLTSRPFGVFLLVSPQAGLGKPSQA
jgi:hypothetical protein